VSVDSEALSVVATHLGRSASPAAAAATVGATHFTRAIGDARDAGARAVAHLAGRTRPAAPVAPVIAALASGTVGRAAALTTDVADLRERAEAAEATASVGSALFSAAVGRAAQAADARFSLPTQSVVQGMHSPVSKHTSPTSQIPQLPPQPSLPHSRSVQSGMHDGHGAGTALRHTTLAPMFMAIGSPAQPSNWEQ
jgi:hypothetical protein